MTMTNHEAIAKVMLVRNDIRNDNTDKYKDISDRERLEYMDALSTLINIAVTQTESGATKPQKTGLELFAEILANRERNKL